MDPKPLAQSQPMPVPSRHSPTRLYSLYVVKQRHRAPHVINIPSFSFWYLYLESQCLCFYGFGASIKTGQRPAYAPRLSNSSPSKACICADSDC